MAKGEARNLVVKLDSPTTNNVLYNDGTDWTNANEATLKAAVNLEIGTDIQAYDAGLTSLAGLTYVSDSFIKVTATDTYAIRTIAETKTDLSLNLVENTALSTWAGTTNITTLGTIATVGNITIADGGTIGQAAGPLLTFDDSNNYLKLTGCKLTTFGSGLLQADFQWTSDTRQGVYIFSGEGADPSNAIFVMASDAAEATGVKLGEFSYGQKVSGKSGTNPGIKAIVIAYAEGSGGSVGGYGSSLRFYTRGDNATDVTERMKLTDTGNMLVGGDVGIGADTPTVKLELYDDTINDDTTISEVLRIRGRSNVTNENAAGGASINFYGTWYPVGPDTQYEQARIVARDVAGYGGILAFYTKSDEGTPGTSVEGMRLDEDGYLSIGVTQANTRLTVEGTITLKEQAAADGDTAAYGQIWIKTATPNELWFTDDAGTDHQIAFV